MTDNKHTPGPRCDVCGRRFLVPARPKHPACLLKKRNLAMDLIGRPEGWDLRQENRALKARLDAAERLIAAAPAAGSPDAVTLREAARVLTEHGRHPAAADCESLADRLDYAARAAIARARGDK